MGSDFPRMAMEGVPNDLVMEYYALSYRLLASQEGQTAQTPESAAILYEFVQWARKNPEAFACMGMDDNNKTMNAYVVKAHLLLGNLEVADAS